jgi:hypothetical protein
MILWYILKKQSMEKVTRSFNHNSYNYSSLDLERMPTIFNQLLTILKHIIETYRLTDSIDVLEYAAKLIHLLQGKRKTFVSYSISILLRRSSFIGKYKL